MTDSDSDYYPDCDTPSITKTRNKFVMDVSSWPIEEINDLPWCELEKHLEIIKGSYRLQAHITVIFDIDGTTNWRVLTASAPEIHHPDGIEEAIKDILKDWDEEIENWKGKSGVSIEAFSDPTFKVIRFKPMSGCGYVALPKKIISKKACINIQTDSQCLRYCLVASLHPASDHVDRKTNYTKYLDEINMGDLKDPIRVKDLYTIERLNPNICITAIALLDSDIIPLKRGVFTDRHTVVVMLYKNHWVLVKNFGRLLCESDPNNRLYVCHNCLTTTTTEISLQNHIDVGCFRNKISKITLAKEKTTIRFKSKGETTLTQNSVKKIKGTDIFLYQVDDKDRPIINREDKMPLTIYADFESSIINDEHKANSVAGIVIIMGRQTDCLLYHGDDCAKKLCEWIDSIYYKYALGSYKIPVFIHNFKGYDCHLIIKDLVKITKNVRVIADNTEKYKSVSVSHFRFIDSYLHLGCGGSGSLAVLVDNLISSGLPTPITDRHFGDKCSLFHRKGIYPYEWVDGNVSKWGETSLPPISEFYSKLSEHTPNSTEYDWAQKVWSDMECKTFKDYHNHYLMSDVTLLADVFEAHRGLWIRHYGLDPAYYVTTPSLSWDSMLKKTGVTLQPFYKGQEDMLLMTESGVRGGVCNVMKRHAIANSEHKLIYLDANNLYGYAMTMPLPYGLQTWENTSEWTTEILLNFDFINCDKAYQFRFDISWPEHLHDLLNEMPPCSQHINGKLISHLDQISGYVCNGPMLQLLLKLGGEISNITKVLSFKQSRWLKPYIDFNNEQRGKASSEWERDLFKLANNSIFGKMIENPRKRITYKLTKEEKERNELVSSPLFVHLDEIERNIWGIKTLNKGIKFDKCPYIGQAILDYSKIRMLEFHYAVKGEIPQAIALYTDTDSLIYQYPNITPDPFTRLSHWIDGGAYPKDHELYSDINTGVLGMMKDEMFRKGKGSSMTEFIGLRPKMYSFKTEAGKHKNKAKGLPYLRSSALQFSDYNDILNGEDRTVHHFTRLKSKLHKIETISAKHSGLSRTDTKRHINEDGVTTLAFGHYKLDDKIIIDLD